MPTQWHRLSSKKSRRTLNQQAREMALDLVLGHRTGYGNPPTAQDVRRELGMRAKSSICEACWKSLIEQARKEGKIAWPKEKKTLDKSRH